MGQLINPDTQGFHFGELRKARKPYVCWLCGAEIKKGEEYIWRKPFWRDQPFQVCLRHAENVGLLKKRDAD